MNQKGFVNIAIIIGAVVMAGIAVYFILSRRTITSPAPTPTPTPQTSTSTASTQTPTANPDSKAIAVSLGQEFTLKKGETARVKDLNIFFKVKYFIYSPCPKGSQCIWSGLAVVYDLTVDGKVYNASIGNLPPEVLYDVIVKETDYKTYATFVINKPEVSCANQSGIFQDKCWRGLAKRFSDLTYRIGTNVLGELESAIKRATNS